MSGDDIDTSQLRAAFVQAQAQIMNNGAYEPVVVISKPLALSLLDEIQRLRQWKVEATTVLAQWETLVPLCDDTLSPHWLGRSKCVLVAAHIARLSAELAAERAECDAQAALVTAWRGVADGLYGSVDPDFMVGPAVAAYLDLRDKATQ